MCALLLRLPFDILEHVVETLDRPDLLSLALSCTTWKHIIIPRHLEYREISLSVDHRSIWKHLAERPSLAANVRRLVITESEYYHSFMSFPPISFFQWRTPSTLVPPSSDNDTLSHALAQRSDYPLRALRNMRLLKTLEFENIFRWAQGSPDTLSLFLAHIPSVENLVLKSSRSRGNEGDGSNEGVGAEVSDICRL
jgi:F-box domain